MAAAASSDATHAMAAEGSDTEPETEEEEWRRLTKYTGVHRKRPPAPSRESSRMGMAMLLDALRDGGRDVLWSHVPLIRPCFVTADLSVLYKAMGLDMRNVIERATAKWPGAVARINKYAFKTRWGNAVDSLGVSFNCMLSRSFFAALQKAAHTMLDHSVRSMLRDQDWTDGLMADLIMAGVWAAKRRESTTLFPVTKVAKRAMPSK